MTNYSTSVVHGGAYHQLVEEVSKKTKQATSVQTVFSFFLSFLLPFLFFGFSPVSMQMVWCAGLHPICLPWSGIHWRRRCLAQSPCCICNVCRWIVVCPVAAVAYQVVLEPGIGQFREFESRRVHTRINSLGLFLVLKLTCGKRESVG